MKGSTGTSGAYLPLRVITSGLPTQAVMPLQRLSIVIIQENSIGVQYECHPNRDV